MRFFVHCGSANLSSARPRKTRSNTVLDGAKVTMVRTYTKGSTLRTLNRYYRQSKQSITISPLLNVLFDNHPPTPSSDPNRPAGLPGPGRSSRPGRPGRPVYGLVVYYFPNRV